MRQRNVASGTTTAAFFVPPPVAIGDTKVITNADLPDCIVTTGSLRVAIGRRALVAHHVFDCGFSIAKCSVVWNDEPVTATRAPVEVMVITGPYGGTLFPIRAPSIFGSDTAVQWVPSWV